MAGQLQPYIGRIDKTFKKDYTRQFELSIQLSLYGFTFAIYSPEREKYVGLESYHFHNLKEHFKIGKRIDEIISGKHWLGYGYEKVRVLVQNPYATLIPQVVFNEKEKAFYLGFNHPFQENHRIVFDLMNNIQAANIYYLANPIVEKVKEVWPNCSINHFSSALIESLISNFKNQALDDKIFVNAQSGNFDIIVFKDKKLHYFNNFKYRTKEDFIYFLLYAIEQIKMNPEQNEVILMGALEKVSELYEILYRYIRKISFIKKNEQLGYSYVFDEIPEHYFYTLLNLRLCEL